MAYVLKPNLERMAKQAFVTSLWQRKDIADKVKTIFISKNLGEEEFEKLIKDVIKLLDDKPLPFAIRGELVYIIRDVGRKIYSWLNFISSRSVVGEMSKEEAYRHFGENIVYNSYGMIDEVKIIKHSWFKDKGIDVTAACEMACYLCLKKDVKKFYGKMKKTLSKHQIEEYECIQYEYDKQIISYWMYNLKGLLDQFLDDLTSEHWNDKQNWYDSNYSVDYNMFRLCVRLGNLQGTEFFFKRIKKTEKKQALWKALNDALFNYNCEDDYFHSNYIEKDKRLRLCQFLLSKFPNGLRKQFYVEEPKADYKKFQVNKRLVILEIFSESLWPWQEYLLPALEDLWDYLTGKEFYKFVQKFIKKMIADEKSGYQIKNSISQRKLKSILKAAPDRFQQSIPDFAKYVAAK